MKVTPGQNAEHTPGFDSTLTDNERAEYLTGLGRSMAYLRTTQFPIDDAQIARTAATCGFTPEEVRGAIDRAMAVGVYMDADGRLVVIRRRGPVRRLVAHLAVLPAVLRKRHP